MDKASLLRLLPTDPCGECKGTGEYLGFNERDVCRVCEGHKVVLRNPEQAEQTLKALREYQGFIATWDLIGPPMAFIDFETVRPGGPVLDMAVQAEGRMHRRVPPVEIQEFRP